MAHIQRCPPSHPGYSQSVKHHARASFRTGPDKPRQIQKTYASDTAFEKLLVAKGFPRNFDRRIEDQSGSGVLKVQFQENSNGIC